ncbi:NAD-dependent epimerase/dehydratase family protein [Aggregicoccus sp. 17bor-14]|uniref:NAD-dependent epimerase/dehydratase family protein n=1 Tax=Myxococcaceae TaxID=31 RepID=UPI00129C1C70|nr:MULTISPECIES: NAD-dependent epimerase/dehydratase family protein [Myxococcaceae]MBF5044946.1 NAD-dependent epimerase/dehydratase family protein [Simulacricoccus sp. 17bor-14]MRI90689.1 NAD-dependent epimerase/dehydratase family protein [Aggregicoccus sp. 17bor-14]
MTTLLTGATGLVGANLAHLLCSRGEKPRLLARERSDRRGLRGLVRGRDYEEARGDILDAASLREALRGVTHVYHAAGTVRFDPFSRQDLVRINTEGTRNVLEAARAAGVRRLVFVSSVAAGGHGTLDHPADESTPFNYAGDNPYHQSKREAEQLALAANAPGFEVLAGCPGYVVGPYDVRPSSGELLLYVARGVVAAYPSGGINVVNAADVAEGLRLVMEKGAPGERYILGGENLTYRQFLTTIAEEVGVAPPRLPMPRAALQGAGRLGDVVGRLSPELFKFVNTAFLQALTLPAYQSSGRAMRELGYHPRPVRLGIREALRWFQEEGLLPRDQPLTPRGIVA